MHGLTLRRACPTDAEAFARMMSEPEVFGGVLQMPAMARLHPHPRQLQGPNDASDLGATPVIPDSAAAWPHASSA